MKGKKNAFGSIRTEKWRQQHSEKMKGENNPNWKGGKRKNKNGYIMIHKPNHPFVSASCYINQSRLIAEKCLKRYLTIQEVVHHINGIKDDDRPENLYVFTTNSAHVIYERFKNKPILISNLIF